MNKRSSAPVSAVEGSLPMGSDPQRSWLIVWVLAALYALMMLALGWMAWQRNIGG